jgi:hypothetical protein
VSGDGAEALAAVANMVETALAAGGDEHDVDEPRRRRSRAGI